MKEDVEVNGVSRTRRKGISARVFMVFLIVIFLSIAGAYYLEGMKKRPIPSRLEIIPSVTIASVRCESDLDCTDTWRCEGKLYYNRTAGCENRECNYGDWFFLGCLKSKENCGADCGSDEDCQPWESCDPEACFCR